MFSIEQIHQAFSKVKSGADFPQLVQDLKNLSVSHYDNFVSNGLINYYGSGDFQVKSAPKYSDMEINNTGSPERLKQALSIHQKGQTDYLTFCRQAADAGVEKWTTDILKMTVTYFDKQGRILLTEPIPQP